jgi:hypothetical protein
MAEHFLRCSYHLPGTWVVCVKGIRKSTKAMEERVEQQNRMFARLHRDVLALKVVMSSCVRAWDMPKKSQPLNQQTTQ